MNHLQYSQKVKHDAEGLLAETNLLGIYSQFGEVYIVGSLAADLMWDPDIDLLVITENPEESAKKALERVVSLNLFQKVEFGDFKNFPRKNRPRSFILNTRKTFNDVSWEIETWFLTEPGDRFETLEKLKALPIDSREEIILKKKDRSESGGSKHDLSSWEIYQEFLN